MGKTDRELLLLAAKASGFGCIHADRKPEYEDGGGEEDMWCRHCDTSERPWNPLIHDDEAFWLMAKLNLCVQYGSNDNGGIDVAAFGDYDQFPEDGRAVESFESADGRRSTRRAIVRAAASVGESMTTTGSNEGREG